MSWRTLKVKGEDYNRPDLRQEPESDDLRIF